MISQVCLVIIALALIGLLIVFLKLFFQLQSFIRSFQANLNNFSTQASQLLSNLNAFVQTDLHTVSSETTDLITKLGDLSSDLRQKSRSLNFLFKPFSFLNSKMDSNSPRENGSIHPNGAIPKLIQWVASSALLFKTTKEFIKNYEKRK